MKGHRGLAPTQMSYLVALPLGLAPTEMSYLVALPINERYQMNGTPCYAPKFLAKDLQ